MSGDSPKSRLKRQIQFWDLIDFEWDHCSLEWCIRATAETPVEKDKRTRNSIIKLIRFLAACEIVCFHADAPWTQYVRILPVFLIFSVVFTAKSHLTIAAYRKKAIQRLIVPWLFWSAVYGFARISRILIFHSPISHIWSTYCSGMCAPIWESSREVCRLFCWPWFLRS